MPLYEFSCRKCEHSFEVLVSARADEVPRCPRCDSGEVARLIGLPAPGRVVSPQPATNCRGDGPPCEAPGCGRKSS